MKVVVDANIGRHAASTGIAHTEDEVMRWGPFIMGLRHYDFHYKASNSEEIRREVPFVPALAKSGPNSGIAFYRTQFVDLERMQLKPAVDWARRSIDGLFQAAPLRSSWDYAGIIGGRSFEVRAAMRSHIASKKNDRLTYLVDRLGQKSSQDAYLLWISEQCGIDAIVTLDLRWIRKRLSTKRPVRILLPSELCGELGIGPVSEEWFAEADPSLTE